MNIFEPSWPLAASLLLLGACTPAEEETDEDTDEVVDLSDLSLRIEAEGVDAYNPYGDGSGAVELVATAEDAVRFRFDLGDGTILESETGEISHTYTEAGTLTWDIAVTAYAESGESELLTEPVPVYVSYDEFPTLVWADEFDVDGAVDGEKWLHQTQPPLDGGWFNGEQQHYTDRADNSFVSDGTLEIVALKEQYTTEGSTRDYTSARLNSMTPFTYGRVEVRAKLPAEAGTWPAIWTLGANVDELGNPFGDEYGSVGWPACGEIDIMEQKGWDKANTIAYFHWGDTSTGAYSSEGGELANPTSTTDFHVYELRWNESTLRISVDDDLVYELENTEARPYDNPHYILLNIAMGGNLGGAIPGDFTEATMEIDYVRVYQ